MQSGVEPMLKAAQGLKIRTQNSFLLRSYQSGDFSPPPEALQVSHTPFQPIRRSHGRIKYPGAGRCASARLQLQTFYSPEVISDFFLFFSNFSSNRFHAN